MTVSVSADGRICGLLEELEAYRQLKPDWDSYGAEPVSESAIDAAQRFLGRLYGEPGEATGALPPYHVAPLSDGGIQLEWRAAEGALEVEIDPAGKFSYTRVEGKGGERRIEERSPVTPEEALSAVVGLLSS